MTIAPESPVASASVVIEGVPVHRFLALHDHLDALTGELSLVATRVGHREAGPVSRLLLLLEALDGPFAGFRQASRHAARRARLAGNATFVLSLEMPLRTLALMDMWNRLLDEADWAGSRGLLLTTPAPPEIVELRRWIGAEIAARLASASVG